MQLGLRWVIAGFLGGCTQKNPPVFWVCTRVSEVPNPDITGLTRCQPQHKSATCNFNLCHNAISIQRNVVN